MKSALSLYRIISVVVAVAAIAAAAPMTATTTTTTTANNGQGFLTSVQFGVPQQLPQQKSGTNNGVPILRFTD